jgi:hypothetical protein
MSPGNAMNGSFEEGLIVRHLTFCSLAVIVPLVVGFAAADDTKKKTEKDTCHDKGTITKVDAKKSTMTVTVKDSKGKSVEKNVQLADGAEYLDCNGKSAKIDSFHPGDHIRITEKDGKVTELKKCMERSHAKITKVDAAKGTVAVSMKDKDGKDIDKTFEVAKGAEYFDSHGKVAKLDAFHTDDHVRITEKDGKITELKECKQQAQATITKVDDENGKITVTMKDQDGKTTEKVFTLVEDAEYFDDTGAVAVIDVFQSGDEVLIIESDGQLTELKQDKSADDKPEAKKDAKSSKTTVKPSAPAEKKPATK